MEPGPPGPTHSPPPPLCSQALLRLVSCKYKYIMILKVVLRERERGQSSGGVAGGGISVYIGVGAVWPGRKRKCLLNTSEFVNK